MSKNIRPSIDVLAKMCRFILPSAFLVLTRTTLACNRNCYICSQFYSFILDVKLGQSIALDRFGCVVVIVFIRMFSVFYVHRKLGPPADVLA